MPPFLPILAISRSQNIRIGNAQAGATGSHLVGEINDTVAGVTPLPYYVDLGDAVSRRDLQRHSAIGGIIEIGNAGNVSSPYYFLTAPAVTATLFVVTVPSQTLTPRYYGTIVAGFVQATYGNIVVPTGTLTAAGADPVLARTDLIVAIPVSGGFAYQIVTGALVTNGTQGAGTVPLVKSGQVPVAWYTVLPAAITPSGITSIAPTS